MASAVSDEKRRIKVAVTFTFEREVPADWTDDNCRFHYEENHCLDNFARELGGAVEASPGYCATCRRGEAKFVGPA